MLSSWSSWFSNKPLFLQESVLDTPELVGWAKQQLGELEDKILVWPSSFQRDIFCCVCVLEKYNIFFNWSSWPVVGPIVLLKLWFECGISSNKIKTNDIRNVVLLVVIYSSIHHYIFWFDQCCHRVHIMVEVQRYGNSDELLLNPSAAFFLPHDSCWTST